MIAVPIRTNAERALRLHAWRLRLYAGKDMFQPGPHAADAHLHAKLAQVAAVEAAGPVPDIAALIQTGLTAAAGEARRGGGGWRGTAGGGWGVLTTAGGECMRQRLGPVACYASALSRVPPRREHRTTDAVV